MGLEYPQRRRHHNLFEQPVAMLCQYHSKEVLSCIRMELPAFQFLLIAHCSSTAACYWKESRPSTVAPPSASRHRRDASVPYHPGSSLLNSFLYIHVKVLKNSPCGECMTFSGQLVPNFYWLQGEKVIPTTSENHSCFNYVPCLFFSLAFAPLWKI